jgi:Ni,Fe-hydrogenase III large subunit
MTSSPEITRSLEVDTWGQEVARRHREGQRLALLYATASDGGGLRLTAALAVDSRIDLVDTLLPDGATSYPSLTPLVPAAFWYEREIHDLFGVRADGHPRLDPLVLPLRDGDPRPRPGVTGQPAALTPDETRPTVHLAGPGMFPLPHGPVRSGVMESVEYLIETPGEDIPHLRVRPYAKHRGIEKRFETLDPATGVLLAERVEGIASVAHAIAYASALENLTGIEIPPAAEMIRVVHAELERIANHLDVAMRLCDAAALGVATARFGWHKERVLRLRSAICGSRYGRGVVTPGGVRAPLALPVPDLLSQLETLEHDILGDERAAMNTASLLDRFRGTGPLPTDLAKRHGALGPIGRASGAGEDARVSRPYAGYRTLRVEAATEHTGEDVQARLRVRWAELHESFRLLRRALANLAESANPDGPEFRADVWLPDGRGVGWAEAPQGEVLYVIDVAGGQLQRVKPRSASFHNLLLFHAVFAGDIFTDFPFIEASFGLSIAGVAL